MTSTGLKYSHYIHAQTRAPPQELLNNTTLWGMEKDRDTNKSVEVWVEKESNAMTYFLQ